MKKLEKKKKLIIVLSAIMIFMGVGYAILSQALQINGTATLGRNTFDIRITNIEPTSAMINGLEVTGSDLESLGGGEYTDSGTYAKASVRSDGLRAQFNATLPQPEDYIEYEVTITNNGTIAGTLTGLEENYNPTEPNGIIYTRTGLELNSVLSPNGGTHKFKIKVECDGTKVGENSLEEAVTRDYTIDLTYTQVMGEPSNPEETDDLIKAGPYTVSVDESGNGTIVDYDYTIGGTSATIPAAVDNSGKIINTTSNGKGVMTRMGTTIPIVEISSTAFKQGTKYTGYKYDYGIVAKNGYSGWFNDVQYIVIYNKIESNIPGYSSQKEFLNGYFWKKNIYVVGEDKIPEIPEGYNEYLVTTDEVINSPAEDLLDRVENITGTFEGYPYSMSLRSLDLSKAINLDYIGDRAFSNEYEGEYEGLTELTIGNNEKSIEVGEGVFVGANIEKLELYADTFMFDNTNDIFDYSQINTLIVKPSKNSSTIIYEAFEYAEIDNLYIEEGITKIDEYAFYECYISKLSLPNTLKSIEYEAFYENQLTSVEIPNSVTTIGESAFSYNQLTSIEIPNSVTEIGSYAFGDNQLTSVEIPDSVQYLSGFNGNQLTSVEIPNSVTTIGESAFMSNQLTSLTLGNSVTEIGGSAFSSNQLTSVEIPNSVTTIGGSAFSSNQLTSVEISNSVTEIGSYAFYGNQLTSVEIPNSVTSIGGGAFENNQLTSLVLPSSVETIGSGAFTGNSISNLTMAGPKNIPYNFAKNISCTNLSNLTILDGITTIGQYAFYGNQLTSLTLGNSVTEIGSYAFSRNQLTSLTLGNSVTTIGEQAFIVNQLTSVEIPNSVTTIEDHAFAGNLNLSTIKMLGRSNLDGMTLGSYWNYGATITYEP